MSKTSRFSSNQPVSGKITPTLSKKTRLEKISQHPIQERNVTVYSDEASMANRSDRESTLQVVIPQAIEELEMGIIPQAQEQLVAPLFGDRRIVVNAP